LDVVAAGSAAGVGADTVGVSEGALFAGDSAGMAVSTGALGGAGTLTVGCASIERVAGALALEGRARTGAGVSRRASFTGGLFVSTLADGAGAVVALSPGAAFATTAGAVLAAGCAVALSLPGSVVAWFRYTAPPITDAVMMPSGIEN